LFSFVKRVKKHVSEHHKRCLFKFLVNVFGNTFSPMIDACGNAPKDCQYSQVEGGCLKKMSMLSGGINSPMQRTSAVAVLNSALDHDFKLRRAHFNNHYFTVPLFCLITAIPFSCLFIIFHILAWVYEQKITFSRLFLRFVW